MTGDEELNPYARLDLALLDIRVSGEVVLDALSIALRGLSATADLALRGGRTLEVAGTAIRAADEALDVLRPLLGDDVAS